jgi:hypothetical protein
MKSIKSTQSAFDSLFAGGVESQGTADTEFTLEQAEAAEDFLEGL